MSYLERFAPAHRELIASLPYRVGVWVSQSDTSGGDDADEVELQALQLIMTGYTEDFLKSEVVEEIMRGTVASKDKWAIWEGQNDKVLQDCDKALSLMDGYIRPEDILSYRQTLMDIGKTVAMAYCELLDQKANAGSMFKINMLFAVDKIKAKIKGAPPPSKRERLNISPQERAALEKLSKVLKVTLEGQSFPASAKDDKKDKAVKGAHRAKTRKTDKNKNIKANAEG